MAYLLYKFLQLPRIGLSEIHMLAVETTLVMEIFVKQLLHVNIP